MSVETLTSTPGRTRVVILGGGFGGVYTAWNLQKQWRGKENVIEIILISRDNYFLMTPLLFEAGSGVLEPRHAVSPIRDLLTGVRFVQAFVLGVDFTGRVVNARSHDGAPYEIPYDHVVIALGGITNTSIVPGSDTAFKFKTLGDAIALRNHAIQQFERADVETDPARKKAMLTFVVVGAGLVGLELCAELNTFLKHLARSYPHVEPSGLQFDLIEAGPRIAPEFDPVLAEHAMAVLRRRGVNVRTGTPVKSIEPERVNLPDGTFIQSQTIIIATGVKPGPIIESLDLEKEPRGRIVTDPTMRAKGRENVWALGDCAAIPSPSGKPYPQLAQHALREARVLAGNITAALTGGTLHPFLYETMGTLAALGHYEGIGRIGKIRLRGFVAWWVWRSYYLMQMPQWRRRIRIMLDWTIALLFKNDIVELDFSHDQPRVD